MPAGGNARRSKRSVDIETIASEEEDQGTSPPSYEILTYPADYTLEILVEKLRTGQIEVPPFQRRFVWNQAQSSKLIESFLLGLPVPPIYLYTGHYLHAENKQGTMFLVDGQQRLRSVMFFFDGFFGDEKNGKRPEFHLTGLHPKSRFANKTFRQLRETDLEAYRKLTDAVLRSFVVKQLNPKDDTSIFYIFERLNTGGTFLQGQEIRNCIYPGPFNELLHELNKFPIWREIVGKKIKDKRQRDVELILRFFALVKNLSNYKKPMKDFLNRYMARNRNLQPRDVREFRELFKETAERVHTALGSKPFHIRAGLNAAVYDSVFVAFAKHPAGKKPAEVRDRFSRLLAERAFDSAVSSSTTDTEVILRRIDLAARAFFGAASQ